MRREEKRRWKSRDENEISNKNFFRSIGLSVISLSFKCRKSKILAEQETVSRTFGYPLRMFLPLESIGALDKDTPLLLIHNM